MLSQSGQVPFHFYVKNTRMIFFHQVADMILEADMNGDGQVSYDEFAKIMMSS